MLLDGLQLIVASTANNFTLENRTTLPIEGNIPGKLFYLTTGAVGLYVFSEGSWKLLSTSGSTVGSDTQISFNKAGVQSGSSALTWDDTLTTLNVGRANAPAIITAVNNVTSFTIKGLTSTLFGNEDLNILGGGLGTTAKGGAVNVKGMTGSNNYAGGEVLIQGGNADVNKGGDVNIYSGSNTSNSGAPGNISIIGSSVPNSGYIGLGIDSRSGGSITIAAGNSSAYTFGANVTISAGGSGAQSGGAVILRGGPSINGSYGGEILFQTTTSVAAYTDRLRITSTGAWSVGSNFTMYGSNNQVLTSTGNGPPIWKAVIAKPSPLVTINNALTTNNFGSSADHNKHIRSTATTDTTYTVQPDSFWTGGQQYFDNDFSPITPGPMPIGGTAIFGKSAAGNITFVPGAGVIINSPASLSIITLHGKATLMKVGSNLWELEGNIGQ